MKLVIDGRGKLKHLIGKVTQPTVNDLSLKKWQFENSLITTWLINFMEPMIGKPHFFFFLPIAKDVWEAVCEYYSNLEHLSQIFDLKTRL